MKPAKRVHKSDLNSSLRVVLAILFACVTAVAWANDQVTGIRTEKIDLYDAPKGAKKGEVRKDAFKGPWPIVGTPQDGFLQVRTDSGEFWVRRFAVETNQKIQSADECGVVVSGRQQKSAATRGLGEECKKP
jgi:hypothetical protein